jgi:hypothetical protein
MHGNWLNRQLVGLPVIVIQERESVLLKRNRIIVMLLVVWKNWSRHPMKIATGPSGHLRLEVEAQWLLCLDKQVLPLVVQ